MQKGGRAPSLRVANCFSGPAVQSGGDHDFPSSLSYGHLPRVVAQHLDPTAYDAAPVAAARAESPPVPFWLCGFLAMQGTSMMPLLIALLRMPTGARAMRQAGAKREARA